MVGLEINLNNMNWYKLVFFHVFKCYYKNGKYTNDIPWLTATGIVSVSTGFLLSSIFLLFYYFFIDTKLPKLDNTFTLIGFIFILINYFWITNKKRYLIIYESYRKSNKNNKVSEVLSWVYIIVGFISLPIIAIIIR